MSRWDHGPTWTFFEHSEVLRFHKAVKEGQHKAHREATKRALKRGSRRAVILLDYKQNVTLGHSAREDDLRFRGLSSASLCGFVVWLPGWSGPLYVDCISANLLHSAEISAYLVRLVVAELVTRPETRDVMAQVDCLEFWADTGAHFRAAVFAKTILWDLPGLGGRPCELNFFCEKHGKGWADAHFGAVTGYVERATDQGVDVWDLGKLRQAMEARTKTHRRGQ